MKTFKKNFILFRPEIEAKLPISSLFSLSRILKLLRRMHANYYGHGNIFNFPTIGTPEPNELKQ